MRYRRATWAFVGALIAAAACGGDATEPEDGAEAGADDGTAAGTDPGQTPGSTPASGSSTPVSGSSADECAEAYDDEILVGWTPLFSFLPVHWALEAGYFADEGLPNVEFVEFEGGTPAAAALLSGGIQFILTSGERPILLAEEAGAEIKNVQSTTARGDHSVIARGDAGIEAGDLDSLRGKKIGITAAGGGFDKTLRLLLRENGIDPDSDVDIIEVGGVGQAIAAMQSDQIDAVLYGEPAVSQLLELEGTIEVTSVAEDYPEVAQLSFGGLQATDEYIEANNCLVRKFVRASSRAVNEMASTPVPQGAIDDAIAQFGGETPPEVLTAALERMSPLYSPSLEDDQALASIDAMVREGAVPADTYTADDLVDDQFADEWETGL